jgi:2,3-bisphosphoglycerate-independent phosphoglycerate mutase
MKYVILVADGMADYPVDDLEGKTPLEAAKTPNMDFIAKNGRVGQVKTIPRGLPPASDVANLSIIGYDPKKFYTGRGPLEAVNLGIELQQDEVAFRCNLVTYEKDRLVDYSAGHITTKEASMLINFLNEKLGSPSMRFYPGVSYRHLLVIKGADKDRLLKVNCWPPHDITGWKISKHLPRGRGSLLLKELMFKSRELLQRHEVNLVRIDLKENPANMIWLWGQGTKPNLPSFEEKFGLSGSVISAVDLIKGIGKIVGLEVINVPGATGYYDTDYAAKAKYGIKSLREKDFLFLHVEAPDEAGHNGDLREKITAIERFDRLVVGQFLKHFKFRQDKFRLLLLSDHATPLSVRTHTRDPVCFAIYGSDIGPGGINKFNEKQARESDLVFNRGHQLMDYLISLRK